MRVRVCVCARMCMCVNVYMSTYVCVFVLFNFVCC